MEVDDRMVLAMLGELYVQNVLLRQQISQYDQEKSPNNSDKADQHRDEPVEKPQRRRPRAGS